MELIELILLGFLLLILVAVIKQRQKGVWRRIKRRTKPEKLK